MAYIYLSRQIPLPEDNEQEAIKLAQEQLQVFYQELISQPVISYQLSVKKCKWEGFKRDDVTVEFDAIKVVESYNPNQDFQVYNNQGWL